MIRDKSTEYFKCREDAREAKKILDKKEFLTFVSERSYNKNQPVNNPSTSPSSTTPFPNIFLNKSTSSSSSSSTSTLQIPPQQKTNVVVNNNNNNTNKENLTNKPYCSSCGKDFGLFTYKYTCDLCNINFCTACIRKLSSKDITGVLREGQVKNYCTKCEYFIRREEANRRFVFYTEKASKEPLYLLYNEISLLKKSINGCLPNFEYLTSSVTDFSTASTKNRETFEQVFNEVIVLQNDLAVLFKDFDKQLKLISACNTTSPIQEKIKTNMKSTYVSFLQQNLPKFKNIQNQLLHLEMKTCTNTYIVLCRISIDNQLNREFWHKYGNEFQNVISIVRKDLFNATIKCGENWDKHKSLIDEMIVGEDKSHLNIQGPPNKEVEGTLIRKNIEVLNRILEQINTRVKPEELKNSKNSIYQLTNNLSMVYKQGLKF